MESARLLLLFLFVLPPSCSGLNALVSAAANPAFMLVSGITAAQEMCVAVEGGRVDVEGQTVHLEPCVAAVAAGDGREIWKFHPNGQIVNVAGKKCLVYKDGSVFIADCDAAASGVSTWEVDGSGQLKLAATPSMCLTQEGATAGAENVAAGAAISASSTADAIAHGAMAAIDGSDSTFWASALDPGLPVTLTLDMGAPQKLLAAEIAWEFPAKAFTVSLSTDGVKWLDVYSTDSNILSGTSVLLNGQVASKIKIVMNEAHASYGSYSGHAVFGIKGFLVFASQLRTIVDDCAVASRSIDARDKYFQTFVKEFAPGDSKVLRSELPSLEAAQASLAATVTELMEVLPKMSACTKKGAALLSLRGEGSRVPFVVASGLQSSRAAAAPLHRLVEAQNGIDAEAVSTMLSEARRVIIVARSAFF